MAAIMIHPDRVKKTNPTSLFFDPINRRQFKLVSAGQPPCAAESASASGISIPSRFRVSWVEHRHASNPYADTPRPSTVHTGTRDIP